MSGFFHDFCRNIIGSFKGKRLLLHGLAILLTAVIVFSGFDWNYFQTINKSALSRFLWPAIMFGGIIPIISPLVFLIFGVLKKSNSFLNTAYALAQSALLGLLISSTYKAFTGRIPPMRHMAVAVSDLSHQFQFGFMRGGVFWGWPSSHTTVAFATMVTLIVLYPKNMFIRAMALLYAFYVGIGVTVGIHWFSEFIAGALIGTAIGVTVGRSFRSRVP